MANSSARSRKRETKGRRRQKGSAGGPLELVLAPIAALAVIVLAAARALLDRRSPVTPGGNQPRPTTPPSSPADGDAEQEPPAGIKGRFQAAGRRFPFLGRVLDVQERYGELRGNNIAAAVTLQSFLSLFPLILVAVAVIGFLSASDTGDVAQSIIRSLGLDGDAARAVTDAVSTAEESRKAASAVGLAGLLWSGLGLVNALQFAFNQVWQVEERGVKDKAVGVAWLAGAGLLLLAGSVLTTVLRWLPDLLSSLGILLAAAINTALWLWTAKVLPNRKVGWRDLLPGALLGGIGLEVLKVVGAFYVPKAVSSSSQLYGSLGVVFAILAWLLFFGRLIVYSAVLNVVLYERRRGTVTTTIEVPATAGADPDDDVTRSGRVQKEDLKPDRAPTEAPAAF